MALLLLLFLTTAQDKYQCLINIVIIRFWYVSTPLPPPFFVRRKEKKNHSHPFHLILNTFRNAYLSAFDECVYLCNQN